MDIISINEGFLSDVKAFLSGEGENSGKKALSNEEVHSENYMYSAELLRGSIITLANKLDNILAGINRDDRDAAKSSISEIIGFLNESFKKLQEIIDNTKTGSNKEKRTVIDEISNKINIYNRPGGIIDKWKSEYLTANHITSSFLDKGRSLMEEARSLMNDVENVKKLENSIKDMDMRSVIKRGADKYNGKKEEKVRKYDPDQDPEIVKKYREKLHKLLITNNETGPYTSKDDESTKAAQNILGSVTGEVYGNNGTRNFDQYQDDINVLINNQEKINKLLK
jgi:hypothetical protein